MKIKENILWFDSKNICLLFVYKKNVKKNIYEIGINWLPECI